MSTNKEKKPKMGAANLRHISSATRAPDNPGPMTNDESERIHCEGAISGWPGTAH
jgi:hypothetical protein